ncbi:MAG: CopG family transcriptional regulator [Gaiellaceae bacterium]
MVRMQIQFTPEQSAELRRQARQRGISISALVREAVDRELAQRESLDDAWRRALAAIGSYHGDGSNVSEEHDEYLVDAYADD